MSSSPPGSPREALSAKELSAAGASAERSSTATGPSQEPSAATLRELAARLGREHELEPRVVDDLLAAHLPLCRWIDRQRRQQGRALVIGVNGAQGSGKTTFCRFAEAILGRIHGWRTVGLSIDDLYLGKAERQRMAEEIHPLFATRGVPGTHDIALGLDVIGKLRDSTRTEPIALPSFDKSMDDRRAEELWPRHRGPTDVVIFEGWCVGIGAQGEEALDPPINPLEAMEDGEGVWRRRVDSSLANDYAALYAELDRLIFLRVPGFEQVRLWRRLQEEKLARSNPGAPGLMDQAALDRFLMHYQRLTLHSLRTLPERADVVCQLDRNHRITGITGITGNDGDPVWEEP